MAEEQTRLDKWLWAARFFKTRSLATDEINNGRVLLNGSRIKPAHRVTLADEISIRKGDLEWNIKVVALSTSRGPAAQAALLYSETAESIAARQSKQEEHRIQSTGPARKPDKKDRRMLGKIKRFSE